MKPGRHRGWKMSKLAFGISKSMDHDFIDERNELLNKDRLWASNLGLAAEYRDARKGQF
jgi:hypothetical protein